MPHFDPPQFGGPRETPVAELRPDLAIVEHSIFCGKDMGLTFYIHPSDAPQLLPDTPDATENERIVLEFTSGLKNTYGGRTNIRFTEAGRKYGISAEDWETAVQSCISKGWLRKNRAITPDGRNVDTGDIRS